jgi:hypothetical protein
MHGAEGRACACHVAGAMLTVARPFHLTPGRHYHPIRGFKIIILINNSIF